MRLSLLVAGFLSAVALSIALAAEDKPEPPKPGAKVYKTPQETYTAFLTAMYTGDHEVAMNACTKSMQAYRLAFLLARAPGFDAVMSAAIDADAKKPTDAQVKAFEPYRKILTEQGWSDKALADFVAKNKDWERRPDKVMRAMVKDPGATYIAVGKLLSASEPKRKAEDIPERAKKLDDVKITGDKATGIAKAEFAKLTFVKVGEGWKLDSQEMVFGEGSDKEKGGPRDKDKSGPREKTKGGSEKDRSPPKDGDAKPVRPRDKDRVRDEEKLREAEKDRIRFGGRDKS